MKEIKEETNKWKNIHVHGLNGLISLKCPYYRFNAILTETLMTFSVFAEIAETILKFIWNHEDAKNTQWSKGSLFIKWYWDN